MTNANRSNALVTDSMQSHLTVFMIGATGLLGSEASRILLAQGASVRSLVLPEMPPGFIAPEGLELTLGNYLDMSDEELRQQMTGADVFVFAAGIDERVEVPPPAYEAFAKVNNYPLKRLLTLAKEAGVRRAVICGSYFTYFNRLWPELSLYDRHPYIRSRVDQEEMALSFQESHFEVTVLGIPYVFGTQPGRRPVWSFLVELIASMPLMTFYARGGTTALTAHQVGEALAGAALGRMHGAIPLGWSDLSWQEMFHTIHLALGQAKRPFVTIPKPIFRFGAKRRMSRIASAGFESSLELVSFTDFLYREAFIDATLGALPLGVTEADIKAAIADSIVQSVAWVNGQADGVEMRLN